MRLTMARGTRPFRLSAPPGSQYIEDEEGELWVVQQVREVDGGYEALCRHATRIEERLYEQERRKASESVGQ